MSLEEILNAILDYGKPSLFFCNTGGWCCIVEMNVSSKGVKFEVKSDHGVATAQMATLQAYDRILDTLNLQYKALEKK